MDKTFVLTLWIYAFLYFGKLFFVVSSVIPTKQTCVRVRRPCDNCKCWVRKQLSPSEDQSCSRPCNGSYTLGLPPVSIVIIFYNEEPILIHNTLYSILNNTPTELIHEIIFVDDNSDRKDLYGAIPEHNLVRVIQNPSRRGLIQSRMIGARAAMADVLVFLDSHVRTDPYWLEPLLARLVNVKRLTMECNRSRNPYKNETCETAGELSCSLHINRCKITQIRVSERNDHFCH
ncbi:hypothetical protein AHF37_08394 [Paragonimus kellicotti]|nr:hypothetical protein AHF37_08394 [Paragonimus kellicotti]